MTSSVYWRSGISIWAAYLTPRPVVTQNVIINGRAYSLAHRDPNVYINFDQAKIACDAKGPGFHLGTMAEWACIALWCRKNGTMPRGNNSYGCDQLASDISLYSQ